MKPKILFITVFYNEFSLNEKHQIVRDFYNILPIEKSFDALSKISTLKHDFFQAGTEYELDDFIFQWRRVRCTYIDDGRNNSIIKSANFNINQKLPENFDYYWFIDSDISFTLENVLQLLKLEEYKILSGVYAERFDPKNQYCAGPFKEGYPGIIDGFLSTKAKGIIPVDWHGAGFLKVHRSVLESVPYRWFDTVTVEYEENGIKQVTKMHEDVFFCTHCKKHGYNIYVNADCVVTHHLDQCNRSDKLSVNFNDINSLTLAYFKISEKIKDYNSVLDRISLYIKAL